MIPEQLKKEEFRFLKIRPKGKEPTSDMKEWQQKNFQYDDEELLKHLSSKGNYGVIGGYGNLILIDSDSEEINDICKNLPATFTVKTGSPEEYKVHYFYIADKPIKPIRLSKEGVGDLGDVRSKGQYVVAANSIHPSGNSYIVINDIPIAEFSEEEIRDVFKKYINPADSTEFKKYPVDTTKRETSYIQNCRVLDYMHNNKIKGETSKNWNLYPMLVDLGYNRGVSVNYLMEINQMQGHSPGAIQGWITKAGNGKLAKYSCTKMSAYLKRFHPDLIGKICDNCQIHIKTNIPGNEETSKINRIEIKLPKSGRLISDFINDIIPILSKENTLFFRNDARQIVEVGKIKHNEDKGQSFTGFLPVKSSRFITLVERFFIPGNIFMVKERYHTSFIFKSKSMTKDLSNTVLNSYILEDTLPNIYRIFTIPIPIIYNEELTFPKIGYDDRFKSWLPYNSPKIIDSGMHLEDSKNMLHSMLKEFCFQTKDDYTIAVAGLITPFLRGLYNNFNCRTPVFIYLGNRERVGKDYLAGINGITYEGIALEEPPLSVVANKGNVDDELRKKILSAFLSGRKRMHFSNNKGYINNAVFEGVITAKTYSDRILGKNETPIFDNELEFSLSGNVGIGFTPDLANRSRVIRLFYDKEDTNARVFENPNLHRWVLDNRNSILSAIYGLVRNWVDKSCPDGKVKFASFPEWARVCGGIMESAGYDSPCNPSKEELAIGGDSETIDMKLLFEHCYRERPDAALTKREIRDLIADEDIFAFFDFGKRADQVRFGNKIIKFIGRVLSNIRMKVVDSSIRSSRQQYVFTMEKTNYDKDGNVGNVGKVRAIVKQKYLNVDNTICTRGQSLPTLPSLPIYSIFEDKTTKIKEFFKQNYRTENKNLLAKQCSRHLKIPLEEVLAAIKEK